MTAFIVRAKALKFFSFPKQKGSDAGQKAGQKNLLNALNTEFLKSQKKHMTLIVTTYHKRYKPH